jgi:hypothetical protein
LIASFSSRKSIDPLIKLVSVCSFQSIFAGNISETCLIVCVALKTGENIGPLHTYTRVRALYFQMRKLLVFSAPLP